MRIKEVTKEHILFDNSNEITFYADENDTPNNCYSWADFEQLDDMAKDIDFPEDLVFESVEYSGFRFGFGNCMFFIPCYNEQNGYYSDDISIIYRGEPEISRLHCDER